MIAVTPRGFKDVLPKEARWREDITSKVQKLLSSWGYAPIETPTLEVLEVLEQSGKLDKTPFRLFDLDGELLVLRPDVTMPIARMVGSRLNYQQKPLRFRYVQPVFREQEYLRGQDREFTQLGIESIGLNGAAGDGEIVLLMVEALKAAGLEQFSVAICTVSLLRELLDLIVSTGQADDMWRAQVLAACHKNNIVEVSQLATSSMIDSLYAEVLQKLLNLRGKAEVIGKCRDLVTPLGLDAGLDRLAQTWDIVEAMGASKYVSIDFSILCAFDYYTGLVLEAFSPGLGVSLGSGGRYDKMLEVYGSTSPAAGFAINLERVMKAMMVQGISAADDVINPKVEVVSLDEADPITAFKQADELRKSGKQVVIDGLRQSKA